jgi:hypothetical protein
MVMDRAEEVLRYDFQDFQSTASMCFTTDRLSWFTGDMTYPPPE